ncbi:MAG: hypothetical protein WAV82_08605 [Methylobacter sp.]|uniref:hypothetical protein n=1 Tax=Methylobacter sp. TaxID=2051955 RepID=UPI0025FC1986|nr:hypothetical protein [Methylobacter sp.]MCK9622924.1 hypothetical protein [Methylobacter sp.]
MVSRIMLLAGCFVLSSAAFANADCVRTATGKVVCGNGENAGSYNPNTRTVKKTETNDLGVKTTETSRGGEAKTKNGVGVVQTPGGTTCVKTRNNQGCK